MSEREECLYHINHRFREEVIVPLAAITNNINFLFSNDERIVLLGDGTKGKVTSCEEVHICALEQDINNLYKMGAWDFIKRWYKIYPNMDTMYFVKLKITNEV